MMYNSPLLSSCKHSHAKNPERWGSLQDDQLPISNPISRSVLFSQGPCKICRHFWPSSLHSNPFPGWIPESKPPFQSTWTLPVQDNPKSSDHRGSGPRRVYRKRNARGWNNLSHQDRSQDLGRRSGMLLIRKTSLVGQ